MSLTSQEPQVACCLYSSTQDGDFKLEEDLNFAFFISFSLQGLEAIHHQRATQFLSKSRSGLSLASVGARADPTCIVLPTSTLVHHVIARKVPHQHIPFAYVFLKRFVAGYLVPLVQ